MSALRIAAAYERRLKILELLADGPLNGREIMRRMGFNEAIWFGDRQEMLRQGVLERVAPPGCPSSAITWRATGQPLVMGLVGKPKPPSRIGVHEPGREFIPSRRQIRAECLRIRRENVPAKPDQVERKQRQWATAAEAERARVRAERRAV